MLGFVEKDSFFEITMYQVLYRMSKQINFAFKRYLLFIALNHLYSYFS
jgi:hypothetical protein